MKSFRKSIVLVPACALIFLFACVTINIYFPAEKVESAAQEIVKDIRGRTGGEKEKPPAGDKNSALRRTLFALASSTAWAEDVTTVSNPTIRALKGRMKGRYGQMKPYYAKGALSEGNDGYVRQGNTGGLNLREKRDLKGLVNAENSDRRSLYQEVARALKIDPSQVDRVGRIFAKEWQKSVR